MGKLSMDLYLEQQSKRYKNAEKGLILEELCSISGYHKKHAIRLLNQNSRVKKGVKKDKVRPKRYPESVYLEPFYLYVKK